jgi:hypothetical protein
MEKAREYLKTGGTINREGFRKFSANLGLGSGSLNSIWLAVLTLGINCDQAELARLRGLDETTRGLELAPPNLYTRPLISLGNLEQLH